MKTVLILSILLFFGGCVQPTALLGPMYTIGTTGNVLQAGASYGTSYAVKKMTGKTVSENINTFVDGACVKKVGEKTFNISRNVIDNIYISPII